MNAYERRLRSQNLVHMLQNRESGYTRIGTRASQSPPLELERAFHKCITPCLTIDSVVIPPVYLRKFTPDGSKLLAFSHDQRSVHIYKYKGFSSAGVGELLRDADVGSAECYNSSTRGASGSNLKNTIFDRLFDTNDCVRLRLCQGESGRFYLHREFSIFLEEGRYVLLAAMCMVNNPLPISDYVLYPDLFDKLDSFSYIFFVVDLELGVVSDKLCLPQDSIVIAHNHGVSAYGNAVAIMSRLHQCIDLYELVEGRLVKQETIGPRPRGLNDQPVDSCVIDVNTLFPISHIKQRVLSFLYRQIDPNSPQASHNYQHFYKDFDFMEHMIIEKMQLVNSDLMLLRYEERPKDSDISPLQALVEPPTPRRLYVFYTITDEEVVGVYHDDSLELLTIIMQFYDQMTNVRSLRTGEAPSSPTHELLKANFVNVHKASPHFLRQAALRFNPSLPISTQSYSISPYLRYNTFSYDDRLISPCERPKACSAEPIVFRDRNAHLVKFRLNAKARIFNPLAPRELCAFICHPFEPLVISIQKYMHIYAHKLHFYNHGTIVDQDAGHVI